jgi:MSHA biogenesis protein MshO
MTSSKHKQSGFTLIEAIMVIVITGILGALASSIASPLRGYFDATARADLSDVADTALRRMARDLHLALPNSIRVSGKYIELLPTTTGGRYRAQQNCSGACTGDTLDFVAADTSFDVVGPLPLPVPVAGNEVVIDNAGTGDAYSGNNVATLTSTVGCVLSAAKICFTGGGGMRFPSTSPGNRFQIIGGPVTYVCDTATATLWRYTGYARQAVQPITIATLDALTNVSRARLATGVDCAASTFVFTSSVGLVTMSLTLSNNIDLPRNPDRLTLLHQVHVQNAP